MTSESGQTEAFYGIESERSELAAAGRINRAVTPGMSADAVAAVLLKEQMRVAHSLRVWLIVLTVFVITVAVVAVIVGIVETVHLNDFIHTVINDTPTSRF